MNTPTHIVLNMAVLGRRREPLRSWSIVLGALAPDVAMFVFYAWAKGQGFAEKEIWETHYFDLRWQAVPGAGRR